MIFPRYHQLDCVRKAREPTRAPEGAGRNYLVQHSAGSGKSNSIGWLAHRLASLHDDERRRGSSTASSWSPTASCSTSSCRTRSTSSSTSRGRAEDRRELTQLAEALEAGVPIVITTLQKFPFVTEKIGELPKRRYAVIVDEAHSSQGGESRQRR